MNTNETLYWRGDLATYTGKAMALHGGLFHEIELLEGHLKGERRVTMRAPIQPVKSEGVTE